MTESCALCGGAGLQAFEDANGVRFMKACACRIQKRADRLLAGTRIPSRYEHCTLDNFESAYSGATRSVASAHLKAKDFVERYPIDTGAWAFADRIDRRRQDASRGGYSA